MTTTQIIQELQHIRKDLAGIMQRLDRIEALLVDMTGLVEIRVLELGNAQTLLSLPDERRDFTLRSERKMP